MMLKKLYHNCKILLQDEKAQLLCYLTFFASLGFVLFAFSHLYVLKSAFLFCNNILTAVYLCIICILGIYFQIYQTALAGIFIGAYLSITILIIALQSINNAVVLWYLAIIQAALVLCNRITILIWSSIIIITYIYQKDLGEILTFIPNIKLENSTSRTLEINTFISYLLLQILVVGKYRIGVSDHLKKIEGHRTDLIKLLRTMAHDVNNLVQTIMLNGQLIQRKKNISIDDVQSLTRMIDSSKMISALIDKVKNFEAIKSGKIDIKCSSISPKLIIQKLETIFSQKLSEKKIHFVIQNNIDSHFLFTTDEVILTHTILSNLISNAIKFSYENGTIECIFDYQEESDQVVITIKDYGIGIPENILKHIYSFDHKTSRPGTANEKGTGFGVPLMKGYIEKLHGSLNITSRSVEQFPTSSGTTIEVRLPRMLMIIQNQQREDNGT